MYCQTCGAQLPLGARACPNCGTITSEYYADSGVSPHEPTQAVSNPPFDTPVAPRQSPTQYGPNPYEANPYEVNPYTTPPPLPPRPPRRVSPLMLALLLVLVLLIIGASVGFVLLRNNQATANNSPAVTPTSTTNSATPTSTVGGATATANAFYSLYDTDTSQLPAKSDPLTNDSQGLQWDQGQYCNFTGGGYHVSNPQSSGSVACMAHTSNYSDFLCQVQMTISKGSYGALIFRSDASLFNFYIFREGQDGVFTFAKYNNRVDTEIEHSPVLAFKEGPNQTNLLAVIAQGSHLIFYINAQYVYDTNDTSFSSGEIGLVAGSIGSPTEVVYNNLKIWAL